MLTCAVSWLVWAFASVVLVAPFAGFVAEKLRIRRMNARWTQAASLLGLQVERRFPPLVVRGEFRGVTLELLQTVIPRYKQAPVFEWKLRAQLSTIKELESAYREPRVTALAPRDPDPDEALTQISGDWVERAGIGVVNPDDFAVMVARIARRARVEADAIERAPSSR